MTETFNAKRVFEQILEVHQNLELQGQIKEPRSRQEILNLTRLQIMGRPRVVLSRIDAVAPDKMLKSEEACKLNTEDMEENLMMMQNLVDINDHTIPFIDSARYTDGAVDAETDDVKVEKAEQPDKTTEESKKSKPSSSNEEPSEKCTFSDLAVDTEIVEMMESLIREENENRTANKLTNMKSKSPVKIEETPPTIEPQVTLRGGRRIRKPVVYDEGTPEPSPSASVPKKRRKRKLKLDNDIVRLESRPQNSSERPEVEILFPASLQDRNFKISLDLNKLDLPPNIFTNTDKNSRPSGGDTVKSKKKSKKSKNNTNQGKSDLAKYFEYFSTNCDCSGQNSNAQTGMASTHSQSPHNTITTTTVDNLQDQISTTQIEPTIPTFLTSNERGEWVLTTQPIQGGQIVTTSALPQPQPQVQQQQITAIKSTAVSSTNTTTQSEEDFDIPMDIENNAFGFLQFIENDNEIFASQSTTNVQQSRQSEVVSVTNPETIKNPRTIVKRRPLEQQTKTTHHNYRRDHLLLPPPVSPGVEQKMYSKLDDNKMRAHASSHMYRCYTPWHEVLDLSAQKTTNIAAGQDSDVIDLSVKSGGNIFNQNIDENRTVELDCTLKNIIGNANETTPHDTEDRSVRKISLEEYKKRNKDLPRNNFESSATVSVEESCPTEVVLSEKPPQVVASTSAKPTENVSSNLLDMPTLNDDLDLDYEFDNTLKDPLLSTTMRTSDILLDSTATKDSGIGLLESGNGSKNRGDHANLEKDNSLTLYTDKALESLLSDHDGDEDDALSIYAHSLLGSPLNISDTNEEDNNLRDICTPEFESEFVPVVANPCTEPQPSSSTSSEQKVQPKFIHKRISSIPVYTTEMSKCPPRPPPKAPDNIMNNFKIPKIKTPLQSPPPNDTAALIRSSSVLNLLEGVSLVRRNSVQPRGRTKSISPRPVASSPSNQSSVSLNSLPPEKEMNNRKIMICSIFGNPCFANLSEACKKVRCQYSHTRLNPSILKARLMHLSSDFLNNAYKFVWRNYKLFLLYFPTFCEIYGEKGNRTRLMSMVKDCEMYSDSLHFLKCIFLALTKTGVSNVNAVRMLIQTVKGQSKELIDILADLILDTDPLQFLSTLEAYSTNPRYRFTMNAINKMARICNQTKHFDLIQILLKIIIFQVSQEELMTYKSADLMTFLSMVRSYHPAQTVQNVCANYISKSQPTVPMITSTGPRPASSTSIVNPALPSITIPSILGYRF